MPVSFPEAALGATITVPDPRQAGEPARSRPGTRSGRTFRVKGHGVPAASGVGDLLVTVEVAVPQKLTDAEREAIEALATASTATRPVPTWGCDGRTVVMPERGARWP